MWQGKFKFVPFTVEEQKVSGGLMCMCVRCVCQSLFGMHVLGLCTLALAAGWVVAGGTMHTAHRCIGRCAGYQALSLAFVCVLPCTFHKLRNPDAFWLHLRLPNQPIPLKLSTHLLNHPAPRPSSATSSPQILTAPCWSRSASGRLTRRPRAAQPAAPAPAAAPPGARAPARCRRRSG